MSASQNKSKRSPDGRNYGAKKKRKKEVEKPNPIARAALITVIVVAVLAAAGLFINSDYLRQNGVAVKIDGINYSVTDFNYYFENAYSQYQQAMSGTGEFGKSMLPSQQTSLKSQIYDQETGETWYDFFRKMALEQMKEDNRIYKAALEANYQLPEEDKQKLEEEIESFKTNGYITGFSDFSKYLRAIYGRGMTEAEYRKKAERTYLISSYTEHVRESFIYTAEDIEAYYTQNQDNFDTYTYRYFLVSAGTINKNDYPDDSSHQAAKGAAIEAAGVRARELAAGIKSEQDFIEAARQYDPEANREDSATLRTYQGSLLGSVYGPWMKDEARVTGDVGTFKSSNGYYVVYFGTRDDNHYDTVNLRQILVKPETINKSLYSDDPNDDEYNAAVEKAKQTAKDTAQKIYDEWMAQGATGEKLEQLTTDHKSEISAEDSVRKENVHKKEMPEVVTEWLFDPSRKPGDTAMLYNEETGYHLVYFEGYGERYSDILAEKDKRDKDLRAWKDSLPVVEPETTWLMRLTV